MIQKLVVVGWVALAFLLAAGATGYLPAEGDEMLRLHMGAALLTGSAFLLAYGGLAIYLVGTAALVQRTVTREGLEARWIEEHRSCWAPPLVAIILAVVPLALAFSSGFSSFTGAWEPWIHHLFFPIAVVFQVPALLLLRSRVGRGEEHLKALDRRVHASPLV